MRRVRAVIVDDSVVLLAALADALADHPEVDVVGTAVDAADAVRLVRELQPEVVLLDLRLGDTWGLDLVPDLRAGEQPPEVVIFSASDVTPDAVLAAGARAQLAKGARVEEVVAVLVDAAARPGRAPGTQS